MSEDKARDKDSKVEKILGSVSSKNLKIIRREYEELAGEISPHKEIYQWLQGKYISLSMELEAYLRSKLFESLSNPSNLLKENLSCAQSIIEKEESLHKQGAKLPDGCLHYLMLRGSKPVTA